MAIFGDFSDFSLAEVIALVGKRTGALHLRDMTEVSALDFYVDEGNICGLVVDGYLIEDVVTVQEYLGRIMDSDTGVFEFVKSDRASLFGNMNEPAAELMDNLSDEDDTLHALRENLPHPLIRFVLIPQADTKLENNLQGFLTLARVFLLKGASAETLAIKLGMPLDHIQLSLYKLRLKNVVSPLRAGWLSGAFKSTKNEEDAAAHSSSNARPERDEIPVAHQSGLVQRMLFALYPRRWRF